MKLALVPVGVAVLLGMLLLPRRATPDTVPLPLADPHALARTLEADRLLAARGRSEPLSGSVRALGSALRDFHTLEAHEDADLVEVGKARGAVDLALRTA